MAQQMLFRPSKQSRAQVSHRKPRTRKTGNRLWAVSGMVLLFLLSLLSGVILAVHGPSESSSSAPPGPRLSLAPEGPTAPTPSGTRAPGTQTGRIHGPKIAEPAARDSGMAKKPPTVKKILLRPGDTLYALAGSYDTTVKTLQQLNELGTSTLIYAGDTLRLPASTEPAERAKPTPRGTPVPSSGAKTRKSAAGKPTAQTVVTYARAQVGKPYVWGGTGPGGYDCSGLVMRAWEAAGVKLPRTTWSQVQAGKATTRAQLVPGDLVISNGGGHVQLYIGDGEVIHAPGVGRAVTVAPLTKASQVVSYRHIAL